MGDVEVPLVDLKAQYAEIRDEITPAIQRVLESQQFIMGPEVVGLEDEIAAYCETSFAIGCGSGSDALLLSLMALDVTPGDQVICPSYTFFATAGSISRLGAVPVFADIDPATFNLSAGSVRAAATKCDRLKAIIPVHLYGQAAPIEGIVSLAEELGVPVIEDSAQALGARDALGQRVGTTCELGCYSFFPTKNLGGYGDGGVITTRNEALAERLRKLRVHGEKPKYYHGEVGINSRLDAMQAAILRVKLRHLDTWNEQRRQNARLYNELLESAGCGYGAGYFDDLVLPVRTPMVPLAPAEPIFNQYVIRVPAEVRDPLRAALKQNRVGTEIYYPVPLHMQACFAELGNTEGDFPHSERAARETIALPVYSELRREQIEAVVEHIASFFAR